MKKHFTKKLALNKETVTNLGDSPMTNVKGGISLPADCFTGECPTSYHRICEFTCGICPTRTGDPCCS